MDLAAFVKEALVQVARGINEAQAEVRSLVNTDCEQNNLTICFDVAVTVDAANIESGHRLNVLQVAKSEGQSSVDQAPALSHRISFQVPIAPFVADPSKRAIQEQQAKNQAIIDQSIERFTSPFS